MNFRVFIASLTVAFFTVTLSSCHSKKHAIDRDDIYAGDFISVRPERGNHQEPEMEIPAPVLGSAKAVIDAASSWMGAPYRYGGNSPLGVDCSGLTCMAFREGAHINLPRSSSEQAAFARQISRGQLAPGDLVFFVSKAGGSRINHVAIYLGHNRIIHSTSSSGVTTNSLDDPYWNTHIYCCGRVLD